MNRDRLALELSGEAMGGFQYYRNSQRGVFRDEIFQQSVLNSRGSGLHCLGGSGWFYPLSLGQFISDIHLRTIFIAIVGPSGSGKTWLAESLHRYISSRYSQSRITIVPEDAYYRDQSAASFAERLQVNYDHPDALEHELLLAHLKALRSGNDIQIPVYDYVNHTRSEELRLIHPAPIVLVEGALLMHDKRVRELFDYCIYLDAPLELCLQRRITRDKRDRGRTEDSVRQQFIHSVVPMYLRFVAPAGEYADLVVGQSEISDQEVGEIAVIIEGIADRAAAEAGEQA